MSGRNRRIVDAMYSRLLHRLPHNNEEQGWINMMDQGASQITIMSGILSSDEFYQKRGTDVGFIELLYITVLYRACSQSELSSWLLRFNSGIDRTTFVNEFLQAAQNEVTIGGY